MSGGVNAVYVNEYVMIARGLLDVEVCCRNAGTKLSVKIERLHHHHLTAVDGL